MYIYIHIHIYIYIYMYIYMFVYMYTYMYVCVYLCLCVQESLYVQGKAVIVRMQLRGFSNTRVSYLISTLQRVAVGYSVWQYVAVCCSVLQPGTRVCLCVFVSVHLLFCASMCLCVYIQSSTVEVCKKTQRTFVMDILKYVFVRLCVCASKCLCV